MKYFIAIVILGVFVCSQNEEQRQNIQTLVADLQEIQEKSEVTAEMIAKLTLDLQELSNTATKPDSEAVQKFSQDLAAALEDSSLSKAELTKLAKDLQVVMESTGAEEEIQKVLEDIQEILQATNITQEDLQKIAQDLKTIKESSQLRATIASFDKDGDGTLSSEEQKALQAAIKEALRGKTQTALSQIDQDGNGKLSRQEVKRLNQESQTALAQQLQAFIAKFDADGDGKLSSSEKQQALMFLKQKKEAQQQERRAPARPRRPGRRR